MISPALLPLANHLWQCTLFAVGVALLNLALRKNRAAVRHRLWLAASIKFLVPFSLFMSAGAHLQRRMPVAEAPRSISRSVIALGQPFAVSDSPPVSPRVISAPPHQNRTVDVLLAFWVLGSLASALWWLARWSQLQRTVLRAATVELDVPIRVLSCPNRLEPGVFGVFSPVLLLPAGITGRLSPAHLQAIMAHELCHVRRRDNLAATFHMVVETLFWFHPVVWWIRVQMIGEQERACDEEVLRLGGDPQTYAESILKICEFYLASPLSCVSGITGSNLKNRIEAIMTNRNPLELNHTRKFLLVIAGALAIAGPTAGGMFNAPPAAAQSHRLASEIAIQSTGNDTHDESAGTSTAARSVAAQAEAPAAAAKTLQVADYLSGLGSVAPLNIVDVKPRVDGPLISVRFNGGEMVQRGEVLATIDPSPYQLQLGQAEFQLDRDRTQLAIQTQPDIVARLQDAIRSDQINVDNAKLQLSYTQVIAPIAGIVGLRLVDPGNIIHAADAVSLLDIKQIQPIAVLFNTPEDNLSQVRTRLRSGANLPVEAWNRDSTVKIATGRLMAFDNQIDPATGAVKLKAVFDNKDEALFPNQFVNVRLFLSDRQ